MRKSGLRTYGLSLGVPLLLTVSLLIAYKVRQNELRYTGAADYRDDIAITEGNIEVNATGASASGVLFGMVDIHESVSGKATASTLNTLPQATEAAGYKRATYRDVSEGDEHASTGNVPNLESNVDLEADDAFPGSTKAAKAIAKGIAEGVSAAAGR